MGVLESPFKCRELFAGVVMAQVGVDAKWRCDFVSRHALKQTLGKENWNVKRFGVCDMALVRQRRRGIDRRGLGVLTAASASSRCLASRQ